MEKLPKEKLVLDLPPSINDAFILMSNSRRMIHSTEAREYIESNSWIVNAYVRKHGLKPISEYTPVKFYFYLRRSNADSHNYKKLSFDCLERGGLFENDKYILDQTMSVEIDPKNPRIEIEL